MPPKRNALGLRAAASSAAGCSPCPPAPCTDACEDPQCSGVTQAIDSLVVNTLFTNTHLGGTLTLQGNHCRAQTGVAFCNRGGTKLHGPTESGDMHILGTTVTEKSLSVGPADGFLVDSVPAGPYSTKQTIAQFEKSVVLVKDLLGNMVVGLAISPTHILTSTHWNKDDEIPTEVQVVLQCASATAYHATVQAIIPTVRLAILTIDDDLLRFETWIPIETDPTKLVRKEGSPVIVSGSDTKMGTLTFSEGVVSQSVYNAFFDFTSMHVTLTTGAHLTDGSIGGYILGPEGTLLAVVQYGTPNSQYPTTIGGVRAPFISYFYEQYLASLTVAPGALVAHNGSPATIALPVALNELDLLVKGKQVFAQERTPQFKAGGIIVELRQLVSMIASDYTNTTHIEYKFGTQGYNIPSLQDSVIDAYTALLPTPLTPISLTLQYAPILGATDFSISGTDLCAATLWNRGCPIAIPASVPSTFTLSSAASNFVIDNAVSGSGAVASTFTSTTFDAAFVTNKVAIAVLAHGAPSATPTVYSGWGKYSDLNTYFSGLGGYVKAAWQTLTATPPPSNNYVFAFVTPTVTYPGGILWDCGAGTSPFQYTVAVDSGLKLTSTLGIETTTVPFKYLYELLSFNTNSSYSNAKGLLTGGSFTFSAYSSGGGGVTPTTESWHPVFP